MKIDGKGVRRLDCRQAEFLGGQFCREERSDGNASARGRRDHTCSKKREHARKELIVLQRLKERDQGRLMPIKGKKMQRNSKPGEW